MDTRAKMRELWKDTFNDSDEYLSITFDNYYSEDYVATEFKGDRLVASLLSVPYDFVCKVGERYADEEGTIIGDGGPVPLGVKKFYRGLYLCGLDTVPELRGRGIMARLINEIAERGMGMGYDFLFLIPADSRLRNYYRRHGFSDFFYQKVLTFPPKFNFISSFGKFCCKNDFRYNIIISNENTFKYKINISKKIIDILIHESHINYCNSNDSNIDNFSKKYNEQNNKKYTIYSISKYKSSTRNNISDISIEILSGLVKFLYPKILRKSINTIIHSPKDWKAVIQEFIISGGSIYELTFGGEILGVAFVSQQSKQILQVQYSFFENFEAKALLLHFVACTNSSCQIQLVVSGAPSDSQATPKGMIRKLREAENLEFLNTKAENRKKTILNDFRNSEENIADLQHDTHNHEKIETGEIWNGLNSQDKGKVGDLSMYLLME
ncbi:MAG: GNAT family N-acetyltransferase [Clostridium sp.]|nr:GNAT family N-acetyltransferase [Prevotella sp.]MCM1429170.1 GNAT family N-acetyltransferase [Clostridium sp.]MCM1475856.1 GNAT family N-acetyltransferase [Muribaculaceae bacterium]